MKSFGWGTWEILVVKEGKRASWGPGRRVRAVLESRAVPSRRGRKMIAATEDRLPVRAIRESLYSPNRFFVLFAVKQWCTLLFRFSCCLPWHVSYKMTNQTQFSYLKICIFRQLVPIIFPSDDKGRARSAEKVSILNHIYLIFLWLAKKKAARSAENFSNLTSFR